MRLRSKFLIAATVIALATLSGNEVKASGIAVDELTGFWKRCGVVCSMANLHCFDAQEFYVDFFDASGKTTYFDTTDEATMTAGRFRLDGKTLTYNPDDDFPIRIDITRLTNESLSYLAENDAGDFEEFTECRMQPQESRFLTGMMKHYIEVVAEPQTIFVAIEEAPAELGFVGHVVYQDFDGEGVESYRLLFSIKPFGALDRIGSGEGEVALLDKNTALLITSPDPAEQARVRAAFGVTE